MVKAVEAESRAEATMVAEQREAWVTMALVLGLWTGKVVEVGRSALLIMWWEVGVDIV